MSIEQRELKQKIKLLKILIGLYQQLLLLKSKSAVCIAHWTATSRDLTSFEAINRGHKIAGYPVSELGHYCAYNVLFTKDKMYRARKDTEWGQACSTYKGREIDIAFTGMPGEVLNDFQKREATKYVNELRRKGIIKGKLRGHDYFFQTECPGPAITRWCKGLN